MRDFIIGSTGPLFYGVIANSIAAADSYVIAIRGTSNGIEWWDDGNAIVKVPFKVPGCGQVAAGFARIYDSLEVLPSIDATAIAAEAKSLQSVGGFASQIATLIRHRAAANDQTPKSATIEITGHSLGSALATLYALENAKTERISNPRLCTFASPLVGDSTFVSVFNALGLTSWRIVNRPDIVTLLPPQSFGFNHVDTEQLYISIGKVRSSVPCWHALSTYLSLIDPALRPSRECQLATPLGAT